MSLKQHLDVVRRRIHEACRRCGRLPSAVTLVAVTKGVPADGIQEAIALGLTELGENRVQEARAKQLATGFRPQASGTALEPAAGSRQPVRWHLIGHLQSNKAGHAVELFDVIHSVDSLALVEELERQAERRGRSIGVFVQVNVSGEQTKCGCHPDEACALARAVNRCAHLRLNGLMTMAPFTQDPEEARPHFRRLRQLRDETATALSLQGAALSLSMGMSQDFEVAIEEGADVVRIGTAIFRGT